MILKPDYKAKTVFEVDFDELKASGVTALVFDLDSTVMKSKSGVFSKEAMDLFENLKKDFLLLMQATIKTKNTLKTPGNRLILRLSAMRTSLIRKIILVFSKIMA